jgi:hypothetical protein
MDRQHILDEIRRTAKDNGGVPLGHKRFAAETGIKYSDWWGKIWARWGDALQEAGFKPNRLTAKIGEEVILAKIAGLILELGRFPVAGEWRLRSRRGDGFPDQKTVRKLGDRVELATKLYEFCQNRPELKLVADICRTVMNEPKPSTASLETADDTRNHGYVYLMRSGQRYKIGATDDIARRGREIAIQMPDPTKTIHVIETDDPFGIEAYWQRRFAAKRTNGEWFELDRADVSAFRRRRFM